LKYKDKKLKTKNFPHQGDDGKWIGNLMAQGKNELDSAME
jgi:hypothetical protein